MPNNGFTLMELVISLALGAMLITGTTQLVVAVSSSYRLQQNLGGLQENARLAFKTAAREIEASGFHPQPWISNTPDPAIGALSIDSLTRHSDRLSVRRWSDRNCNLNLNPVQDENGHPRFYLVESTFSINGGGNFAMTCRYGPGPGQLVTQINNLGLVENAEAFQVLYANDFDDDGNANQWIKAGQWTDESRVRAIRMGLLLASRDALPGVVPDTEQVLDETLAPASATRLRKVFESTFLIKGRKR